MVSQFLILYGNNFALTGLVETGDLQPLQNLNQLTHLDLENCVNLIGQSESEICTGTTSTGALLVLSGGGHRTYERPHAQFVAVLDPWTDWVLESTEK